MDYKVHPTAIIDKGAIIGKKTKIWHYTHVSSGAKIGKEVTIGQNVFIGNKVIIGDKCKIQNNVSIFEKIELQEGVFCGPSMVFTNVLNPRALFPKKDQYRKTLVKKGATLGANCTIICGITIGDFAFVGAGALVNKNVKPYSLIVGVPGKHVGWMSEYGEKLDLPLNGEASSICPSNGDIYNLKNNYLTKKI